MSRYFYTPPLTITDTPSDSRHSGGGRKEPIGFIVLHATGPYPALTWLTTDPLSNVSCHRYITKDGDNHKLVPDSHVAYTQGFADVGPWSDAKKRDFNQVCLSIELENLDNYHDPYPDVQINECAMQVLEWHSMYGFLPTVSHAQVDSRKIDPAGFPWDVFYRMYRDHLKSLLNTGMWLSNLHV